MKMRIVWIIALVVVVAYVTLRSPRPAPDFSPQVSKVTATADSGKSSNALIPPGVLPENAIPKFSRPIADSHENSMFLAREIERSIASTNDSDHDLVFTNLLPALVTLDPAMAAHVAENMPPGLMREELMRDVSHLWSAVDPTAAVSWAAHLENEDDRKSALTDACLQMAQTDPASAIAVATQYDLGGQNGTLENLAQIWAAQDLPSALNWARAEPPGEQRDQMLARVAFVQSQTQPAEAANLIATQMTPGSAQDEAAISVLHQWALSDPATAAQWMDKFPDNPLRERARIELSGIATYQTLLSPP